MATLNITYRGRSADVPYEVSAELSDNEIRNLAVELVRSGDLKRLSDPEIGRNAFRHFVVDRFGAPNGAPRIYLRPKVPFGVGG